MSDGTAKSLTDIAPNLGVHDEGVHKQHKAAYKKPGGQKYTSNAHAVVFPWKANKQEDATEKSGDSKESEFCRRRHGA